MASGKRLEKSKILLNFIFVINRSYSVSASPIFFIEIVLQEGHFKQKYSVCFYVFGI
jgi:hypothetical protein